MTDLEQAVINAMLATDYAAGGRGPLIYDCYGMVCGSCRRLGWPVPRDPLLFSDDPREQVRIFRAEVLAEEWLLCPPQDGAVAFRGKVQAARHVGLVIGGGILHTQADIGPEYAPLSDFDGQRWEYARWVG